MTDKNDMNMKSLHSFAPQKCFRYSDNVTINYETYGSGDQGIIFLHGFGASLNTWNDIKVFFPLDRFQLFLIDLKGFGFSSKPRDENYSINEQARIVLTFIKRHSLKNIVLVGHSYGGGVALLLQLDLIKGNEQNIVDKLVLIDAAAYPQKVPFFIEVFRNPILRYSMLNLFPSRFKVRSTLGRLFYHKEVVTSERVNRYAWFLGNDTNYSFAQSAKQIVPPNFDSIVQGYKDIRIPTLIIWGKDDPIIPVEIGERLHKAIPNSYFKIINDCGHVPHEEAPAKTFNAIDSFLSGDEVWAPI